MLLISIYNEMTECMMMTFALLENASHYRLLGHFGNSLPIESISGLDKIITIIKRYNN